MDYSGNEIEEEIPVLAEQNIGEQIQQPSKIVLDFQLVLQQEYFDSENQTAGKHDLNINFNEKMAAGTYLLRIISGNGQVNIKLVKE